MSELREHELLKQIKFRDAEIARLNQQVALMREKLDALARRIFGKKSEQLDPSQLQMLLEGFDAAQPFVEGVDGAKLIEFPKPKETAKAPKERKPRLPDHLPVIEERIIPDAVKASPELWSKIGEEVSERLDYEPARFLRLRTVRPKYVKRGETDAAPVIAPLPPRLLERSIVAPGLLAQIIVSKYCDHLPLYRQENIYWSRHEVWLPRQTMAEWTGLAADWLKPIYKEICEGVLKAGYVQVDETPIRYLDPGNGKTKTGYLWACAQPGGDVFFHWETSRAASCLDKVIPASYLGWLQCDGYDAYQAFAKKRASKIRLGGCFAHVRRKFFDALELAPRIAGWVLRQIAMLYDVEKRLRKTQAGPILRKALRASESKMIMTRLHRALNRLQASGKFLPQSSMGAAISYALKQWPMLLAYMEDGRLEIDNNNVENAIRPSAIGKKNWLFIGCADAGERSAILYTIIESCRKRGIDPFAYLRDVFTRLPSMTNWQVKDITPEAWAKERQASIHKAAA